MAEKQEVQDRKFAVAYRQTEEKAALESLLNGPRLGHGDNGDQLIDSGADGSDMGCTSLVDLEELRTKVVREKENHEKMKWGSFARVTEVGSDYSISPHLLIGLCGR